MMKSILRFLLVVLVLILPCLTFAEEPKPTIIVPAYGAMEFEAGEVIVKFREGVPQTSVQSLLLAEGMSILHEMDNLGLMLLSMPKGQELEKIEELKRNPLVEYAEPNYIVQVANTITAEPRYSLRVLDVIPNDPYFPSQWNLAKIEAPAAWEITTGSDDVVIAVIGTGVDLDHAELRNKIWTNPGEIPGNGIDDDRNGYVDDVHGWDFVNQDGEPQDDHGYGTFVATVAAAETNNGLGVTGLSGGAETMPIVADTTSVLFETSLGSLDGVTVTNNTANGLATATLPSQVPGMAMITATSDSEVATTAVTTQAVIASRSPEQSEGEAKQSPSRKEEIASSQKPVLSEAEGTLLAMTWAEQLRFGLVVTTYELSENNRVMGWRLGKLTLHHGIV